jgi:Family of unknown function (DUF6152)
MSWLRIPKAGGALISIALAMPALAHHSFAVFFDADKSITVKGTVVEFLFRNPHGIIRLDVRGVDGMQQWRAETNSPSILERRGWSRDSLKAGDEILVEGWPARDGTRYLRMRKVTRADGSAVGVPIDSVEQR